MRRPPTPSGWPGRSARRLAATLIFVLLGGCGGDGLSGRYADPRGATDYEFRADGRVFISIMGTTTLATYELVEDRVVIDGPDGITVLYHHEDELQGPLGLRLIPIPPEDPEPGHLPGGSRS
jgi:hypothetical protein